MSTLPSEATPVTDAIEPEVQEDAQRKKLHKDFRGRISASKEYRRKLVPHWQVSVDYRRGKPYASQSDEDRVAVPLDWALTEMKQSLLFSQVPAVRINHVPHSISKEAAPWLFKFEQKINDTLLEAGIETAMDECLPDCINAAGIGVVMVSYEAITENQEIPAIDLSMFPPQILQQVMTTGMLPNGAPIPMETVPNVVDHRYAVERISPADFLWPVSFNGSNFDKAPWIGRSGQVTWPVAQQRWKLDPVKKRQYIGSDIRREEEVLSSDIDKDGHSGDEFVTFDEIFYREHQYDHASKSYTTIHHLIFINGQDDPVLDEVWKGQEILPETSEVVGARRYPLRVLTLTYVSDEAIPPSDSAIGRSQVNEINKARTQMIRQRESSIPIRTFDVNRIDPTIQYALMRGTWQGMIPVQGVGANIISEVGRAAFPNENFKFDEIAKADLFEMWMVGQDFSGRGVETKGEANTIATNTNVRISRARAKVGKFYTSIAEVLGGLISVYEDGAAFGQGFSPKISRTLVYSILADSTLLLDSKQRREQLMEFMNFTAKSGRVDIESILKEIATLSGLDPNVVVIPPAPKPPVEPNISLRLTGTEDMLNPLTLAFILEAGQGPKAETIEAAKKLIQAAVTPPPGVNQWMGQPTGGPPQGTMDPNMPQRPPVQVGDAEPNWGALDRVNQRVIEREGGPQ